MAHQYHCDAPQTVAVEPKPISLNDRIKMTKGHPKVAFMLRFGAAFVALGGPCKTAIAWAILVRVLSKGIAYV